MEIKSILVVTDLGQTDALALDRAGDLARAHQATLTLVHPTAVRTRQQQLWSTARQLQAKLALPVHVTLPGKGKAGTADCGDLLVMSHGRVRTFSAMMRGHLPEQVLRRHAAPLLVVKGATQPPYRRVLAPVDFSGRAQRMLEFASALNPTAAIELFHVLSTAAEARLLDAGIDDDAISAWREGSLRDVRYHLLSLADWLAARRGRMMTITTTVRHGDPGRQTVAHQELCNADLIVIGWRRQSRLVELVRPSTALRVIGMAASDVLVVPHDRGVRAVPELSPGTRAASA